VEDLDNLFIDLIQNQTTLNQFADFMVGEAFNNLPELKQVELAIAAQERQLKSNNRAFYLPTVAFVADYDYPIATVNPGESLPIPDLEINNEPTWNAAFSVSIPIFAGGSRKYQQAQTKVGLFQLQDQEKDLRNLLELQVRANLENVNAAYNNIRLTRSAAKAAEKNTAIVRDLYRSGQVDVITLVDAQNALLSAQINATNATYQFMIDYFSLQRSVGSYSYLATEAQRNQWLQRFLNFKNN
ncbi:MAG: TolC family protein, partial [Bacteroidota bacterium]